MSVNDSLSKVPVLAPRTIMVRPKAPSTHVLSVDLLNHIFQFVSHADLDASSRVCRRWRVIATERIVRHFLCQQFPSVPKVVDCGIQQWLIGEHKKAILKNMRELRCRRSVTELFKNPDGRLLCVPLSQVCRESGSLFFNGDYSIRRDQETQERRYFSRIQRLSLSDGTVTDIECEISSDAMPWFVPVETVDRECYLHVVSTATRKLLQCVRWNVDSLVPPLVFEYLDDIWPTQLSLTAERFTILERNRIEVYHPRSFELQCKIEISEDVRVQKEAWLRHSDTWRPVDIKINEQFLFVMMRGQNNDQNYRNDKLLVYDLKSTDKPLKGIDKPLADFQCSTLFHNPNHGMHLTDNFLAIFVPAHADIHVLNLRDPVLKCRVIRANAAITKRQLNISVRSSVPAKGAVERGKPSDEFLGCTSMGDVLAYTIFGCTRIYDLRFDGGAHIATLKHPFSEIFFTALFDGTLYVAGNRMRAQEIFPELERWDFSSETPDPAPAKLGKLRQLGYKHFGQNI